MGDYGRSAHKIKKKDYGPHPKKKNMGSAHILVLGFLGAHNPYTPTPGSIENPYGEARSAEFDGTGWTGGTGGTGWTGWTVPKSVL